MLFNKNQTTLIRHPQAKGGAFIIPPTVTSIASGAFDSSTALTALTIPPGVTSIGSGAFSSCSRLTAVAISASVTSIGSGAFGDCLSLAAIDVDAANPEYSSVDGVLFNHDLSTLIQCPAGRTGGFAIPPGCTIVSDNAFADCVALSSVTIPATVISIQSKAFSGCTGLLDVVIPPGVTTIGDGAFSSCLSLSAVTIPAGVSTIGARAFENCVSLVSAALPAGLAEIGERAFSECSSLAEVEIPSGITTIKAYTFLLCTSLTNLIIPATVMSIQDGAFAGCDSLQSIIIPASATSIGSDAFAYCDELTDIHVDADNLSFSSLDGVLFNKTQTTLVRFPSGRSGTFEIPTGVITIGNSAFESCRLLSQVLMCPDVVSIDSRAFANCTSLPLITPGPGVTSVGSSAFSGCAALEHVTIGPSVASLGSYAFSGCDNLTSIEVDAANPSFSILGGVLYDKNQTNLIQCPGGMAGTVAIPSGVVTIETNAFSDSRDLSAIEVDPSNSAFSSIDGVLYNKARTTLIRCPMGKSGIARIPAAVTLIHYFAFYDCQHLTEFQVDEANPDYLGLDRLLYNKEGTVIFHCPAAKTGAITLSNIVTYIDAALANGNFLTAIHVDKRNPLFASVDGVLFNKSLTELILYPGGKPGYATIPASVVSLGQGAFSYGGDLAGLVFLGNAPPRIFYSFDPSVPVQHFAGAIGFSRSNSHWSTVINMGAQSPVKLWLLENDFPFDIDVTTDTNGDGVSLLMAYALNLNPRSNLASSMPAPGLDGGFLSITFFAASSGITYRVETCNDLGGWTTDGVAVSLPDTGGFRTASVPAADGAGFLRLAVSE